MNDYRIECYIEIGEEKNVKLSEQNKKEIKDRMIALESRALSEYYGRNVIAISEI